MDDALAAGSRVGRYEIVRRLAIGGMAEIYLARMTGLAGFAKHVVVKRILPSFAKDAEFVRMFLNEARYAATLDHPNISHVYDFGQEGGLYYYAMEYLHGDDCRALLRELAQQRRKMPLAHALTIVVGAATGCHFAHELVGDDGKPLGLVHRDVSPSNVVITYAGAIKLVDFGIAKATQREDATAAGVTKGKLAYMAPEQCRAEPLDRRVDVYALGVLLYELTTQRRAFTGENDAAIIWAVMSGNVTWPTQLDPDYPPALEAIIKRAMHFERGQRYLTARDLAEAVEGFARDAGHTLAPTRLAEFFTEVMGARPEPWRDGEGRAATATPTPSATLMPPTVATDVPTAVLATPARVPALAATAPAPLLTPAPVAPPPRSRAPWLIAGATVAIAGGAVAVVLARGQHTSEAAPVAVVTERGTAAVESTDGDAGAPAPTVDAGAAGPDAPPAPRDAGARGSATRPRPTPPAGDPLSAAFARRQGAVEACLERHRAAATAAPQLTLRFEIDAAGAPTRVDVQPAAIAGSPLGACIAEVGRSTRFPPQGGPTTFRINLQVSQQPGNP
ncbi:MAG: protein kinase [Myxococcales bacterium]|nr:protein kinase [Myxococcales bacterium]